MLAKRILKTVILPAATVVAAAEVKKNEQEKDPQEQLKCKPSELPIYTKDNPEPAPQTQQGEPGALEEAIGVARRKLSDVYMEVEAYQKVGAQYLGEGKENAEWLLKYLRQEDNVTPKAGAIAIGGLTGFILGLRGGKFKRAVYATTGALVMASVCYPKEASEYTREGFAEVKKLVTIAYNFAYGVKKDDPPLELPSLPKMPSTLSEAWGSLAKSATNLVSGEEKEPEAATKPDKK